MKNPFVMISLMAAAMTKAFRENVARNAGLNVSGNRYRGARGLPGPRNPAGTKLMRKFYRNRHGVKGTRKEAAEMNDARVINWVILAVLYLIVCLFAGYQSIWVY